MGVDAYKTVLSPVWMTRPIPEPLTQWVPWRATFFVWRIFVSIFSVQGKMACLQEIFVCHDNSSVNRLALVNNWKMVGNLWWKEKHASPVKILRSNCKSALTSMSFKSAGTFSPMLMVTIFPGTSSFADTFVWPPSRRTNHQKGACLWLKPWFLRLKNLAMH